MDGTVTKARPKPGAVHDTRLCLGVLRDPEGPMMRVQTNVYGSRNPFKELEDEADPTILIMKFYRRRSD